MGLSTNRTNWPVNGGAVAIQPGWNTGHPTAFFYINMGFGTSPPNMSFPMVPVFQIIGPSRDTYPGTFCLPQVPLPANTTVKVGDNATIQVIEVALHGASLYNVSQSLSRCQDVYDKGLRSLFLSALTSPSPIRQTLHKSIHQTASIHLTSALPKSLQPLPYPQHLHLYH
jgi:hypothetical protein